MKDVLFKNLIKIAFLGALVAAATYCGWDKIKGLLG
jgi:hypothetical protein